MVAQCGDVVDDFVGGDWELGDLGLEPVQVLGGVLVGLQIFVDVLSDLLDGLLEDQQAL